MIITLMIVVFIVGYAAIALEHPIKVDKAASALIIGGLGWGLFAFSGIDHHTLIHEIQHHIVDIAEILFFLLGAMTIVELVDAHQGFSIITDKITTNKKVYLIWILSVITFFFSAVLDNLTTAIVMAALLPKLIKDKEIADILELPPIKLHCSVLAEETIKHAIEDWEKKTAQRSHNYSGKNR